MLLSGKGIATFTITATAGINGVISPWGTIIVEEGSSRNFTFIPNVNYCIAEVLVDGVSNPDAITNGYYLFDNIMSDHTIHVEFIPFNIDENEFRNVKIFSHSNHVYIQNVGALRATPLPTVEILDMMGRLVYQGVVAGAETTISLQVSTGIYTVRLISQENIAVRKVAIFKN